MHGRGHPPDAFWLRPGLWHPAQLTPTPHPGTREYRNQTIRITDLAVTEDFIREVRFENCEVVGPAVLAPLQNVTISGCAFDTQSSDELFWVIPEARHSVIGAIGLVQVEFFACRFRRVGLAIPEVQVANFMRGFGFGQG